MRHFEVFELEHLLNSTGNIFFRWRCRIHLKKCEICKARMERLIADKNFVSRFRTMTLKACNFVIPDPRNKFSQW